MDVTFTKTDGSGYRVTIARTKRPAVRTVQGSDAYLPQELAQLVVEEEFGIRFGVFGQFAAGETAVAPGQPDRSDRRQRAARRNADAGRADLARSTGLVALSRALWEARAGRASARPAMIDMTLATPFDVDRVIHRFDEVSRQWRALAPGASLTVEWPDDLALEMAGAGRGSRRG